MPIGEVHTRKKKTNRAILAAVMAWVALIWIVAMVKMSG
jgi:hypothetical protein